MLGNRKRILDRINATILNNINDGFTTPESCFITNEKDASEIIRYTCSETNIVIPSSIKTVPVKKIGDNSFEAK